jgi:thiol:disulfide interchange protein DsbD
MAFTDFTNAYLLGVLSSFTPCVFPLIPITLALFGAKETKSRFEGFLLGLSYVLGIALTYTTLGMITAKLDLIFGSLLGNPWVIFILTVFLLLITLQTLEMLEFSFISSVQTKASKVGGKGLAGAFLMGTVSGLVAAPCIGPALIGVLTAAAKSQNVLLGALLMFCYSIGLGTIFLILATYSELIQKLPKSGNWLNGVKFFLACLLLMIIIFLTQNYLSVILDAANLSNNAALLLVINNLAIILAWISYRRDMKLIRLIAALLMSFTLYQFFLSTPGQVPSTINTPKKIVWIPDFDLALKESKSSGKILIVDLYADWCGACKEFEKITFSDPKVSEKLSTMETTRIDFTDITAPLAVKINERYQIPGLPVIMLIKADGSGDEIPDSRITGFMGPEEFLKHLDKYLK